MILIELLFLSLELLSLHEWRNLTASLHAQCPFCFPTTQSAILVMYLKTAGLPGCAC